MDFLKLPMVYGKTVSLIVLTAVIIGVTAIFIDAVYSNSDGSVSRFQLFGSWKFY